MKITVGRKSLETALAQVKLCVDRKHPIPILAHAVLAVTGGQLTVTGSNLDAFIAVSVAGDGARDGKTTAPLHDLLALVHDLPDGCLVAIEAVPGTVTVRAGRYSFDLPSLDPADFPATPGSGFAPAIVIEAAAFRATYDRAKFAISTEASRYYLNGMFWHMHDGKLRSVATDGHRMALVDTPVSGAMPAGVIVPAPVLAVLRKIADGVVALEVGTTQSGCAVLRFTIGGTVLTAKAIDGTFPDYSRITPDEAACTATAELGVTELTKALKLLSRRDWAKSANWSFAAGTLTLTTSHPDGVKGVADVDCRYTAARGPLETAFNSRYVLDILAAMDCDGFTVKMTEPGDPALFLPADSAARYVLMPRRV